MKVKGWLVLLILWVVPLFGKGNREVCRYSPDPLWDVAAPFVLSALFPPTCLPYAGVRYVLEKDKTCKAKGKFLYSLASGCVGATVGTCLAIGMRGNMACTIGGLACNGLGFNCTSGSSSCGNTSTGCSGGGCGGGSSCGGGGSACMAPIPVPFYTADIRICKYAGLGCKR